MLAPLTTQSQFMRAIGHVNQWLGRECDRKLAQYRAALDSRASPATVAAWIAETEAERAATYS